MPVLETSQEQARRQRWLAWLIAGGLALTLIAVVITIGINASRTPKAGQSSPSPEKGVTQQNSGYTFTRSDKGRPVFTVHAARTVSYESGNSTTLEDVRVETYGRKGDTGDILRTDRCQYNAATGDFYAAGPVQIEMSANSTEDSRPGLRGKHHVDLETSKVAYAQNSKIADTDEPVRFRMGTASGTATGMTYNVEDGSVELKHDVRAELLQEAKTPPGVPVPSVASADRPNRPSATAGQPIHLTASNLRYDKISGIITLSGPVGMSQGETRGVADHGVIYLGADKKLTSLKLDGNTKAFENNELRAVEADADHVVGTFAEGSGLLHHIKADGNVKGESKTKASTSHFSADHADLDLVGKQPQPIEGVAVGNVRVEGESRPTVNLGNSEADAKSQEKKILDAAELHMTFRPDTHGLKWGETVGPGTLTISPNSPQAGQKVINSGHFVMDFDSNSRIQTLAGSKPTKVLLYPAPSNSPPAPPAQSTADRLDATFNPATGDMSEMRQSGNFLYVDGDRNAKANEAEYNPQTQSLILIGHPVVFDPQSRIISTHMNIDLRTNTAIGEGNVKGFHQQTPAAAAGATRNPPLPTNVLADKVVANKASQVVHYEGHVRAWNGADVVEAPSMDVFRTERRVSSASHVVTSFMQAFQASPGQEKSPHQAGESHPVTIQADALEYLDEGRRARYHGHVRMTSESLLMDSDRLDVYLTQADSVQGSQVDHAVADGKVKVTEPDRVGTGDHAEYYATDGKIVMTGGPPVLVDEKKGSTTGQRLTFFTHDDRLIVDGGAHSPSLTEHRVAP